MKKRYLVIVGLLLVELSFAKDAISREETIATFKAKIERVKKTNDEKLLYKMGETLKCYEDKVAVPDDKIDICETIFLNPQDQKKIKSLK